MARKVTKGVELGTGVRDSKEAEFDALVERVDGAFEERLRKVKPAYRERYLAITELTGAYCMSNLEPLHREYEQFCQLMAIELCRKGSPVVEGKGAPEGWAAAIVASLGFVNFLGDAGTPPTRTMAQVAAGFGVSESSMSAKSGQIRRMLELMQFDPRWTLPSLLAHNPLV